MIQQGQVVLVLQGSYKGLLGFVENPSYGHQVGVWFRQQGAPPAQFALLDVADLAVVGFMPGTESEGSAVRSERERALAIVRLVRARVMIDVLTAAEACDEIYRAIECGEVERKEITQSSVAGGLRTTLAQATDEVSENGFATGVRFERERILTIINVIRSEAISYANTAYGSGSEGPENTGRWKACDAIANKILRPSVT